jgi:hypothetical protein
MELNKITLVGWVNKALEQSLTKKISNSDLRPHVYGPFNPKAMDNKTQLSQTYTAKPIND